MKRFALTLIVLVALSAGSLASTCQGLPLSQAAGGTACDNSGILLSITSYTGSTAAFDDFLVNPFSHTFFTIGNNQINLPGAGSSYSLVLDGTFEPSSAGSFLEYTGIAFVGALDITGTIEHSICDSGPVLGCAGALLTQSQQISNGFASVTFPIGPTGPYYFHDTFTFSSTGPDFSPIFVLQTNAVPEPSSILLFASGAGFVLRRFRRRISVT